MPLGLLMTFGQESQRNGESTTYLTYLSSSLEFLKQGKIW